MSSDAHTASVHILDKEYRFSCTLDERDALLESARFLDSRMREIRDTGRTIGIDRIAVMAALNIAHEMLHDQTSSSDAEEHVVAQVRNLTDKIEAALQDSRQLELS